MDMMKLGKLIRNKERSFAKVLIEKFINEWKIMNGQSAKK